MVFVFFQLILFPPSENKHNKHILLLCWVCAMSLILQPWRNTSPMSSCAVPGRAPHSSHTMCKGPVGQGYQFKPAPSTCPQTNTRVTQCLRVSQSGRLKPEVRVYDATEFLLFSVLRNNQEHSGRRVLLKEFMCRSTF